jgi:hypothetical protein
VQQERLSPSSTHPIVDKCEAHSRDNNECVVDEGDGRVAQLLRQCAQQKERQKTHKRRWLWRRRERLLDDSSSSLSRFLLLLLSLLLIRLRPQVEEV